MARTETIKDVLEECFENEETQQNILYHTTKLNTIYGYNILNESNEKRVKQ